MKLREKVADMIPEQQSGAMSYDARAEQLEIADDIIALVTTALVPCECARCRWTGCVTHPDDMCPECGPFGGASTLMTLDGSVHPPRPG